MFIIYSGLTAPMVTFCTPLCYFWYPSMVTFCTALWLPFVPPLRSALCVVWLPELQSV
jgi:hypothetical protein